MCALHWLVCANPKELEGHFGAKYADVFGFEEQALLAEQILLYNFKVIEGEHVERDPKKRRMLAVRIFIFF